MWGLQGSTQIPGPGAARLQCAPSPLLLPAWAKPTCRGLPRPSELLLLSGISMSTWAHMDGAPQQGKG